MPLWRWMSVTLGVALVLAGVLAVAASREPFDQRIVRVAVAHQLPSQAAALGEESPALNAVFLSYADDPTLWMSARLAILQHGDLARSVLIDYALDPGFQRVLARYGADAVLPVGYYRDHDIATLRAQHWLGQRYRQASERLGQWWGSEGAREGESESTMSPPRAPSTLDLTPLRRGQMAVAILDAKGHDFLQQFVVDPNGDVQWLQSERVVSDLGDFFTSGLRGLESQWRRGEAIGVADVGWAGVDLLVAASAVKVLRVGRVAGRGAMKGQGARSAALMAGGGRFVNLPRMAKLAAVGTTAYVVVRHPSLVSALGANLAQWLGWPVWLGQFLLWLAVLVPLLIVVRFVYRWVLAPLCWLIVGLIVPLLRATSRVPRWMAKRRAIHTA